MFSPVPNLINCIQLKESFEAELHLVKKKKERAQVRDWKCLELDLQCPVLPYNKKKNIYRSAVSRRNSNNRH